MAITFTYRIPNSPTLSELYARYPEGGEQGWYSQLDNEKLAAWDGRKWIETTYTLITKPTTPVVTHQIEVSTPTYSPDNPRLAQLASIPVLKYLKDPASKLSDLYARYPEGGEYGWYAFVFIEKTFAWWNSTLLRWSLLSNGEHVSPDTQILTTPEQIDITTLGIYGVHLSENYEPFGISTFSMQVMPKTEDIISQFAHGIIDDQYKIWIRQGNISTGDWTAWKTISGGSSYVEPTMPDPTITSAALAMLPAGSNVSGKNALEILDMAINAELFPLLTPPSHSFSITPSAALQEVGSSHSIVMMGTFNRGSINPQYQSDSPFRSGTLDYFEMSGPGIPDPNTNQGTFILNSYTIAQGANTWSMLTQYNQGVQPKGSKGTNFQSPLPSGSLPTTTRTITGVYPIFATTANISVLTKQALQLHTADITVSLVAEGDTKQEVRIPQAHNDIVALQQYNTLSGQWDSIDLSTFTKTTMQVTINGIAINYHKYVHNGASIGARQLRFKV